MHYSCLAAPTCEPIRVAELRAYLRMDCLPPPGDDAHKISDPETHSADDALLHAHIVAARQQIEHLTGQRLLAQEWRCTGYQDTVIPDDHRVGGRVLLPFFPVLSVRSVLVNGQTPTSWNWHQDSVQAWLHLDQWPVRSWSVDLTFGYGDSRESIPPGLRLAIMAHAARLFDQPDQPLSAGVRTMIQPYCRSRFL